jgi:maltose O-acetyltransferase
MVCCPEERDMSEKSKMLAGRPYLGSDPELVAEHLRCQRLLAVYNATPADEAGRRVALLRELLGGVGEGTVVRTPLSCDYGCNIHIGANGFINYNCTFLDCAEIRIGDNLQMAPMVQLYTALHPLDPEERRSGLESAKPIRIGNDVWLGGGAIVLPGVTHRRRRGRGRRQRRDPRPSAPVHRRGQSGANPPHPA